MKIRARGIAAALAAGGFALALSVAPASAAAIHGEFTVPAGTQYVQVTTPIVHGQLTGFAVDYTDNYIHKDPIPAASKVTEIDNFTGQAPDVQGWDGCTNSKISHPHQPDQLSTTDNDSNGLGGGTTPATGLHHNVTVTIKPVGSGQYFLWCHYEHGPETWVKLTFADGSTVEVYWATPTYFLEMFLAKGGTTAAVTALAGPDE